MGALAEHFGMSRRTVSKRLQGCKPNGTTNGYATYSLPDAAAFLVHGKVALDPDNPDPSQLTPKERDDWFSSEKKRLDVETTMGALIPADDFRIELAEVCKSMAQFLETLPDILERDCGLDGPTTARMIQVIDAQREDLAARLTDGK